ncbi:MAG: acetyl-CoA carboxylase biotin carboxyl carrier protein subunit [Maribacter sp.]|nr:acetyl-CoA carboxylase biotin carboxyl carrier protein subunit [Maribacter sp.]
MDSTFKVMVNENMSFDITNEDIVNIDSLSISENMYHILQDNKPFVAEIISSDFNQKSYIIKVNNNRYDVDISDGLDLLIKQMGFSLGTSKNVESIYAPMPGLILEINVREGQAVNENDPLLILEAMKMENVITSPRDGIVKSVSVEKGDAVEKKQLLIEFE